MNAFGVNSGWIAITLVIVTSQLNCTSVTPRVVCPDLAASETWVLEMVADNGRFRVAGHLYFTSRGGATDLVATTADGAHEPIKFPVENLDREADSLQFSFAPIGYQLRGQCLSQTAMEGKFRVPQPPFEEITGRWTLTRGG